MNIKTYPHFPFRSFAQAYEDLPAFHAAYFMLVLIFAGLCNLGFFAVLIVIHFLLDWWKYRSIRELSVSDTLATAFRENIADISLFFLALASLVYLHPLQPHIAVLTGPAALLTTIVSSAAILLPKLTILHHSLRIVFNMHEHLHGESLQPHAAWNVLQFLCLVVLLSSICLLASIPFYLHVPIADLRLMLSSQLIPWRF